MSPTGIRFTHLLGAVFILGGVVFMLFLEKKGFLFGIPYVVIGLVLVGGASGVSRRATRAARDQDGTGNPTIDSAAVDKSASDSSASTIRPDK